MQVAANPTDGAQVRADNSRACGRCRITICAPAIAATIAAALYLVEAARPPTNPASANSRSGNRSSGVYSAAPTAASRIASDPVTSKVVRMSVIAKCESRTCSIDTARSNPARMPVFSSATRRPSL